jgi:hypothetical protein
MNKTKDGKAAFQLTLNAVFSEERLSKLPPDQRSQFDLARAKLNDYLKGLDPVEQVVGAEQAKFALNDFLWGLAGMFELQNSSLERVAAITGSPQMAANSEGAPDIESIIKARVDGGQLFPADVHITLMSTAKESGLEQGRQEIRDLIEAEKVTEALKQTRLTRLTDAGFPAPHQSLFSVLEGEETAFEGVLLTAKTRKEEIGARLPEGSESWQRVLFSSDDVYSAVKDNLLTLSEVTKAPKKKGNPMALGSAAEANGEAYDRMC